MDKKKDNLKQASYDVCFQPMVNVSVRVADPKRPTEDEISMILQEAAGKIGEDLDNKLSQENAAFIELYSTGKTDSNILATPVTMLDCMLPYIPAGIKDDVITKRNLGGRGWKYSRIFKHYTKSAGSFCLHLLDNDWLHVLGDRQGWTVMVTGKYRETIGKLTVTTYSQIDAFCQFVQTVLNQGDSRKEKNY